MQKKIIILIIGLVILFPYISDWYTEMTTPDKVIQIREQVSDDRHDILDEVQEEDKISKYENLYDELEFSNEKWDPERYPDYTLQVFHPKNSYFTNGIQIWDEKEGGIAVKGSDNLFWGMNDSKVNVTKLTIQQLEELKEIIE